MTVVVMAFVGWFCVSVLAAVAWASLKRDARRVARIQAERAAANRRTLAHVLREPVS